eukprot:gene11014-biopygen7188
MSATPLINAVRADELPQLLRTVADYTPY